MKPDFDPIAAANAEIGWWKAHHEKNWDEVKRHMSLEYQLLFGLKPEIADKIVSFIAQAGKAHDRAEKATTLGESQLYWDAARNLLIVSFEMLKEALSKAD